MNEISVNNKRILKNTIFLYFRMLLVMAVSLFTSRVILQNLGVVDFGIYNVVGGVVTMMAVVNSSMAVATQRYITFDLGKGDYERLNKVFSTSMFIYILLSFVLIGLAETIGLWWVNNKLIIPADRIVAANYIFQYAIISCVLSLLINPYNATIIAHERMDYYAYLSIIEVTLKLFVAYVIATISFDRLNTYGFLLMCVQGIVLLMYYCYCKHYFQETRLSSCKDKELFKELISYSGWNLFAAFSGVAKGQGLNIMLNVFFGPAVNAARGIAYQINAVITQFFTNFYIAVKPQITKYYAQDKHDEMFNLVFLSARMSFFLILFISLPIMVETPMVIRLWLGKDIDYVIIFTRLIIVISAIDAMATPLMTVMHATGKIKLYQLVIGTATILILPISYLFLKYSNSGPSIAFIVSLCTSIFCMFARLYLVNRQVKFPIRRYIVNVFGHCTLVAVIAAIIPILLYLKIEPSVLGFLLVCFLCFVSSGISVFYVGMNRHERNFLLNKIVMICKRQKS